MSDNTQYDPVDAFYGGVAAGYGEQYDSVKLTSAKEYPANFFRLQTICKRIKELGIKRVIDMGLGEGSPAVAFKSLGTEVRGFDYTEEMVEQAKKRFKNAGMNPEHVLRGDILDPATFEPLLGDGLFDAATCLGVMPHVEDDALALSNIRSCLVRGGRAFVSFRNILFSLFTMNRYTHEMILGEILRDAPENVKEAVNEDLKSRLRMDMPPVREKTESGGVGYDRILARFHNPLEMRSLFETASFKDIRLHFYHFHPAPPYLEGVLGKETFRSASMAMERFHDDWRGHFLCSAYVVEAEAV